MGEGGGGYNFFFWSREGVVKKICMMWGDLKKKFVI